MKQEQQTIFGHYRQNSHTVRKRPRNWEWLINAIVHISHQDGENKEWFSADLIFNVLKKYHRPTKLKFVVNYMSTLKRKGWVQDRMVPVKRGKENAHSHSSIREYLFLKDEVLAEIERLKGLSELSESQEGCAHA